MVKPENSGGVVTVTRHSTQLDIHYLTFRLFINITQVEQNTVKTGQEMKRFKNIQINPSKTETSKNLRDSKIARQIDRWWELLQPEGAARPATTRRCLLDRVDSPLTANERGVQGFQFIVFGPFGFQETGCKKKKPVAKNQKKRKKDVSTALRSFEPKPRNC